MTVRPLLLLTAGLLAVATIAIDAKAADKDRSPRNRRDDNSSQNTAKPQTNSSASGNTATPAPRKFSLPQTSGKSIGQLPNNGSSSNQLDALRNRLQQRNVTPSNNSSSSSRNLPQLTQPNSGTIGNRRDSNGASGNTGIVPNSQLRDRFEQFRGQPVTGNKSTNNAGAASNNTLRDRLEQFRGQPATGNNSTNNSGAASNNALRDRFEQFRGQNPGGNNGNVPSIGRSGIDNPLIGQPRNGNVAGNDPSVDQLRNRLREQMEQARKNSNRDGTSNPGNAPADFKDRFPATSKNGPLQSGNSTSPKLDDFRNRVETRKPDLSRPNVGATDVDRLRERLKELNPNNGGNRLPANVGAIGKDADKLRLDFTRKDGVRPNLKIDRNIFDRNPIGTRDLVADHKHGDRIRTADDLRRHFDRFQDQPEVRNVLQNTKLQITDFSGAFQTKLGKGSFNNLVQTDLGRKYDLDRQFNLFVNGDVTRQLNLNLQLIQNGGWQNRSIGPVYSKYTSAHFSAYYPGPSWYPSYCWTPNWSPWVQWCFWDYCRPIYDPRPFLCRPIYYYNPCPPIVYYDYPIWQPLPVVACGTWVDVPLSVVPNAYDLQLLAIRFVDPGHPAENLGPRYRAWIYNRSNRAIQSPFNVLLAAANDENLVAGLPQAGVTVEGMEPEAVVPVDIRLPIEANRMNRGPSGQRTPFTTLHVLVDSHRELPEVDESNNGLAIGRGDILPVDPAAFSTEEPSTFPGEMVSLAGEGFGPEPGQLIVTVGNRQIPAEIHGWYDLGVYFKMPNLPVTGDRTAQILVIRGDGAASNPVTVEIASGI